MRRDTIQCAQVVFSFSSKAKRQAESKNIHMFIDSWKSRYQPWCFFRCNSFCFKRQFQGLVLQEKFGIQNERCGVTSAHRKCLRYCNVYWIISLSHILHRKQLHTFNHISVTALHADWLPRVFYFCHKKVSNPLPLHLRSLFSIIKGQFTNKFQSITLLSFCC